MNVKVESTYQKNGKVFPVTLPALKIFSDILQHLETTIERRLGEVHGAQFTREDIEWVLTVPAMWTACARDFMRQAAREVSLGLLVLVT